MLWVMQVAKRHVLFVLCPAVLGGAECAINESTWNNTYFECMVGLTPAGIHLIRVVVGDGVGEANWPFNGEECCLFFLSHLLHAGHALIVCQTITEMNAHSLLPCQEYRRLLQRIFVECQFMWIKLLTSVGFKKHGVATSGALPWMKPFPKALSGKSLSAFSCQGNYVLGQRISSSGVHEHSFALFSQPCEELRQCQFA